MRFERIIHSVWAEFAPRKLLLDQIDIWTAVRGKACVDAVGSCVNKIVRVTSSFATPTFITLVEPLNLLAYDKGKFRNTIS